MNAPQELLQRAARAISLDISFDINGKCFVVDENRDPADINYWNPLANRAEAEALAAWLKLQIEYHDGGVSAFRPDAVQGYFVDITTDADKAYCHAVVEAAGGA